MLMLTDEEKEAREKEEECERCGEKRERETGDVTGSIP